MAVTTIYTCDCLNLVVMSGPHLKLIHVPVAGVYNALWLCHFFMPSSPGLWASGGEANVFVYGYGNRRRAKNAHIQRLYVERLHQHTLTFLWFVLAAVALVYS